MPAWQIPALGTWEYAYDGSPAITTTTATFRSIIACRRTGNYRGERWDSDLSLYYLRARYYNPLTGRFMSQDPQQQDPLTPLLPFTYHSLSGARKPLDPIRWHRYLYANADPVNMIDPSGHDAAETAGGDADSIELTEKTIEEIKETSFVDKFNDLDAAIDQLESLEDNLGYCDEGYCGSSKKSLDAVINIAKTLKLLP